MCVTLTGISGSTLAEKCTSDDQGQPFLASDGKNIVVPFNSVSGVKSIKVSFNAGKHAQIQTFIVEGCSNAKGRCKPLGLNLKY